MTHNIYSIIKKKKTYKIGQYPLFCLKHLEQCSNIIKYLLLCIVEFCMNTICTNGVSQKTVLDSELNFCIFYEQHNMACWIWPSSVQSHAGGFYKPIHLKGNRVKMTLNVVDLAQVDRQGVLKHERPVIVLSN